MSLNKYFLELKGNINHSVCRWCYQDSSLEELCEVSKAMGIKSIDLVEPVDFPVLHSYDLDCGMVYGLPKPFGIEKCFNERENHAALLEIYTDLIPLTAKAGFKNVICFSGNRHGISDAAGIEICAEGLKPVLSMAEEYGIQIIMELLNSKVDHPDYQCDHTAWGVDLCQALDHPNFGLLYDIYHMQIMEGDIIATINKNFRHIKHYHTGGVPGRNEIDKHQELNYPAIMEAIVETGYKGYVAQEFIPLHNPFDSLHEAIKLCDV